MPAPARPWRLFARLFAIVDRAITAARNLGSGSGLLDQAIVEEVQSPQIVPRRGMILAAALMAIFMPAAESSIVATALPTIIGDLGGFELFSWVFPVPVLGIAGPTPLCARPAAPSCPPRVFFACST